MGYAWEIQSRRIAQMKRLSSLRFIMWPLLVIAVVAVSGCKNAQPKDNPENWKLLKLFMPYAEVKEILGKPDVDQSFYAPGLPGDGAQPGMPGGLTGTWYYNLANGKQFAVLFVQGKLASVTQAK